MVQPLRDGLDLEAQHIREYVEGEAGEEVSSLEKVKTEGVFGKQYDIWDVRTYAPRRHRWSRRKKNRWWVVTNLTNLYPSDKFPSLDFLLSFHIGLMARIIEGQRKTPSEEQFPKFREVWRRFEQAVERFNLAREAEDFQAVGNHLRECLLAFARDHADAELVPNGEEQPKLADFQAWSRLVVRSICTSSQREYLQKTARNTWDLVQPLVHDRNASSFDAELALDAVSHFMHSVQLMAIGHERGEPPSCPDCGSYRLVSDYRVEEDLSYTVCIACKWEQLDEVANSHRIITDPLPAEGPCVLPPKDPLW
jgi:hypothetical protein